MMTTWSNNLQEQTRKALNDDFVGPDGFLHMKNINGSYGKINLENLLAGKLLIQDKLKEAEYIYSTSDEIITDGWVID